MCKKESYVIITLWGEILDILILSCNTGGGHNTAARSIKNYFEEKGETCRIEDALAFWSTETSKLISGGHIFVYRNLPKLFGICYRHEEIRPKDAGDSILYKVVYNGCKGLAAHLRTHTYDAVISTHPFASMMLTELKKRGVPVPRSYFIITDYTCSPGVEKADCDIFFIPHEKLRQEFRDSGVKEDKIVASGIPIKEEFFSKTTKDRAKALLKLNGSKRTVLLSCGSMGCGPIKYLAEKLPLIMPRDVQLVVICGTNRRLYSQLIRAGLPESVKITGFTSRMSLYMDASDLMITKPGGLTVTEAAAKRLPMIFINAVPGCETRNLEFFVSNSLADTRNSPDELAALVCDYLNDSAKLQRLKDRLEEEFNLTPLKTIYGKISEK